MATRTQLALDIIYGSTTAPNKRLFLLEVDFWDGVMHVANFVADVLVPTKHSHTAQIINNVIAAARKTILNKDDVQHWVEYKLQMVVAKLQSIDKEKTPIDYAHHNGKLELLHELLNMDPGATDEQH